MLYALHLTYECSSIYLAFSSHFSPFNISFRALRGCSCVAEGRTSVKLYFHDLGVESRDR